jgi:Uma2 family endonuclease
MSFSGVIGMAVSTRPDPKPTAERIPPLEPGDSLTRAEFERRYDAMPNLKKAELIEGIVYMPSPVSQPNHGKPHFRLIGWLAAYEAETPGIQGGDTSSVRLDLKNMPQPDALLLVDPECGGHARISADAYVESAPELVAEVSSSSVSFDLNTKFEVYRRNGVLEYVVWRVQDEAIDWFLLQGNQFVPLVAGSDGFLKSQAFPGLWLDPAALIRGDMSRVMKVVRQGIATTEHAKFVERLAKKS